MTTVTKERTTSAADMLQAARTKRDTARRAHAEAQQRAGRAVRLVQQGGPDALEVLTAREQAVSLERAAVEAERALAAAETELAAATEAYGRERAEYHRPRVRSKLAELDETIARVCELTTELEELGQAAKRDGAGAAFDGSLVEVGALTSQHYRAWRPRMLRGGWLAE